MKCALYCKNYFRNVLIVHNYEVDKRPRSWENCFNKLLLIIQMNKKMFAAAADMQRLRPGLNSSNAPNCPSYHQNTSFWSLLHSSLQSCHWKRGGRRTAWAMSCHTMKRKGTPPVRTRCYNPQARGIPTHAPMCGHCWPPGERKRSFLLTPLNCI